MNSLEMEIFIERMKTQIGLSWEKEAQNLSALGLKDGMSVLEIGSGPGLISEKLLGMYPNICLTSVEMNPELARWSKEYLNEKTNGQVHVIQADILKAGLPDCKFDFALARLVFQHLSDPLGCAREIYRMLKPGGKLVIVDIDEGLWGIMDPFTDELMYGSKETSEQVKKRGGDRQIGRKLWRILRTSGFKGLDVQTLYIHSDEMGIEPFFLQSNDQLLRKLIEGKLISKEAISRIREAYDKFMGSEYPYAATILFLAYGEK